MKNLLLVAFVLAFITGLAGCYVDSPQESRRRVEQEDKFSEKYKGKTIEKIRGIIEQGKEDGN